MSEDPQSYPDKRIDSLEVQIATLTEQVIKLQTSRSYKWSITDQGTSMALARKRSLGLVIGMLFLTLGGYALYFSVDPRTLAEVAVPAAGVSLGLGLRLVTDWYGALTNEVTDCEDTADLERSVIQDVLALESRSST
jgi:hypothetical protein